MSPATTRQRVRSGRQEARRRTVQAGVAPAQRADLEPPINAERLGPAQATEAYAAVRRERAEARARLKRAAQVRAAAAKRVTVVSSEPERKVPGQEDALRQGGSTLLGVDGQPLHAEQLVGPDGRALAANSSAAAIWLDDAESAFDLFDDDAFELDELERRERYGRHVELAHLIREFGQEYLAQAQRDGLSPELLKRQERVLRDLMGCRTSAMGEHAWDCEDCGAQYLFFNSCGNRHCPKCREHDRREWAEKLEQDLLPVEYHHLILTLPRPLTELVMAHGEVLYAQVMRASGEAILAVGKRLLNAQLAAQVLLHTWGQTGNRHVHSHCLVPAGGMPRDDPQERAWIGFPEKGVFLSLERLANDFRDLFLDALKKTHASGALKLTGRWRSLESCDALHAWLEPLQHITWIVRHRSVWTPRGLFKGSPFKSVVGYLARYANRVVIANNRLTGIEGDEVLFRYKDYRDGNQWKTQQMPGVKFLEQFLQHMLPPGLHNKRRYGFWGYRVRTKNLALIRAQRGVPAVPAEGQAGGNAQQPKARHCALCKAELTHVGGTCRPTLPVILNMVWSDMQRALDVHPASYHVRTYSERYFEEIRRISAAQLEVKSTPDEKQPRKPSKQNQRRGPPPDRQRRLELASSNREPDALLNQKAAHVA